MAFRLDKLTIKAQEAVQREELAAELGNPQIEPIHLLAGLVAETEGVIRPVLDKIGANRGQLEKILQGELKQLSTAAGAAAAAVVRIDASLRGRRQAGRVDEGRVHLD